MLGTLVLFAEEAAKQPEAPWWTSFVWLLPVALLFYMMILRPARRQEQQRQSFLSQLKKNDRVLTTAGIYGTLVSVSDTEDEVVIRVDDNTRLRMVKSSIARNLSQEEAAVAAKAAQAEAKKG